MADQQQTLTERLRAVAVMMYNHAHAVTARAPEEVEVVVELYEDATTIDTLADEVEVLEVDAAVQREALIALTNALDYDRESGLARQQADDALATNAGKALLERLRRAEAERDEMLAEVREWLCETCNTVYPGPPAAGVACVICPRCGGLTGPRANVELRQVKAERDELRRLLQQQYDRARTESPTDATCDNNGED